MLIWGMGREKAPREVAVLFAVAAAAWLVGWALVRGLDFAIAATWLGWRP